MGNVFLKFLLSLGIGAGCSAALMSIVSLVMWIISWAFKIGLPSIDAFLFFWFIFFIIISVFSFCLLIFSGED